MQFHRIFEDNDHLETLLLENILKRFKKFDISRTSEFSGDENAKEKRHCDSDTVQAARELLGPAVELDTSGVAGAVHGAARGGLVLSVEPDPLACRFLAWNLRELNLTQRVWPLCAGIRDPGRPPAFQNPKNFPSFGVPECSNFRIWNTRTERVQSRC